MTHHIPKMIPTVEYGVGSIMLCNDFLQHVIYIRVWSKFMKRQMDLNENYCFTSTLQG